MKQKNTLHAIAGYIFALYSLIEIVDCATVILMTLGRCENQYPEMYYTPMNLLFTSHPGYLIPLFAGITGLRIFSTLGMLTNKSWKLPIAMSSIATTFILVPFMLPISVFDFLICSILIVLLITGNNKPTKK